MHVYRSNSCYKGKIRTVVNIHTQKCMYRGNLSDKGTIRSVVNIHTEKHMSTGATRVKRER